MDIRSQVHSVSLALAAVSLLVSIAATWIARSSLSQARRVADRDRSDWKQRKWFDLYLKANEAHDTLDQLQTLYADGVATQTEEFGEHWNQTIMIFRELHAMAMVFPKNPYIDELLLCTIPFKKRDEALSGETLKRISAAMEGIRTKAFLDPSIL